MIIDGKQIRVLREEVGITQTELARRVGVSQAHIAKIEAGKVDPRLSTVNRILSFFKSNKRKAECRELMEKGIIYVSPNEKVKSVIDLMKKYSVSQIPVIENRIEIGSISESTIVRNMGKNLQSKRASEIMEPPFPIANAGDDIEVAKSLLEFHPAVLVNEKGKIVGIITKSDLLSLF